MRRTLVHLAVSGVVLSGTYGIGFGASESDRESGELPPTEDGDLEIHHIDVGQADATLVVTPATETILIDSGDWRDGGETVIEYLDEHGDGVGAAYDSGIVHAGESHDAYLDAVRAANVTLFEVVEGEQLPIDDETVEATVVNPPADAGDRADDHHYNSIALSVEYGEVTYLTTGAAERGAEQRLVDD